MPGGGVGSNPPACSMSVTTAHACSAARRRPGVFARVIHWRRPASSANQKNRRLTAIVSIGNHID
jgi:hypothetical protein